jgi:hypothetical protein
VLDARLDERVAGTTPGGLPTTGHQHVYEARGPGEGHVWLADVRWADGEREIRRTRRFQDPWWQDRLLGRRRMAVQPWGDDHGWVELSLSHWSEHGRIASLAASEYELSAAVGVCVRCALQSAGAQAMGRRQEVLGVRDERREFQCVTFPLEADRVPVVAFLLVHVLPLLAHWREHGGPPPPRRW